MLIWNFKKQEMEEGVEPPAIGRQETPVIISHKNTGETKIISIKDKQNEDNRIREF